MTHTVHLPFLPPFIRSFYSFIPFAHSIRSFYFSIPFFHPIGLFRSFIPIFHSIRLFTFCFSPFIHCHISWPYVNLTPVAIYHFHNGHITLSIYPIQSVVPSTYLLPSMICFIHVVSRSFVRCFAVCVLSKSFIFYLFVIVCALICPFQCQLSSFLF